MNTNTKELNLNEMETVNGGFNLIRMITSIGAGAAAGAGIGGCAGGPVGALTGGAVGGVAGAIFGVFTDD